MTTKMRDRVLNGVISLSVTVIAVFVAFRLNSGFATDMDFNAKLDSKADKIELNELREKTVTKKELGTYVTEHDKRHEREAMAQEKFLEQLDKRHEELVKAIEKRFEDFKEYVKEKN